MFCFRSVFSFDASTASSKKQFDIVDKLEDFSEDEGGIATVWAMFWLILCFSISGLAVDVTNAWKVHAILQSTADITALAGAYELSNHENVFIEEKVEAQANDFASLNMNPTRYGDVLSNPDIRVGYWDGTEFKPMTDTSANTKLANAVQTITRQTGVNGTSAVGTFFLRFVGFDRFNVVTSATAKIFVQKCNYDGLIAAGQVKLSTGQRFYNEFCVHGEEGIFAAQDNFFDVNTVASAPTIEGCGQNAGKCTDSANEGFNAAFRIQTLLGGSEQPDGSVALTGKPGRIDKYLASLSGVGFGTEPHSDKYVPDYINNPVPVGINLSGNTTLSDEIAAYNASLGLTGLGFIKGTTYVVTCRTGKSVDLSPTKPEDWSSISEVVIVGKGCDFSFDPGISYHDLIVATDSTSQTSFHANSSQTGVVIGMNDPDDPCDAKKVEGQLTGAVTLITKGSARFAAKLSAFDLEIIAEKNVLLAASPNNPQNPSDENMHIGTSVSAGGTISVTHNHSFYGCPGNGMSLFDPVLSWALVL